MLDSGGIPCHVFERMADILPELSKVPLRVVVNLKSGGGVSHVDKGGTPAFVPPTYSQV